MQLEKAEKNAEECHFIRGTEMYFVVSCCLSLALRAGVHIYVQLSAANLEPIGRCMSSPEGS